MADIEGVPAGPSIEELQAAEAEGFRLPCGHRWSEHAGLGLDPGEECDQSDKSDES